MEQLDQPAAITNPLAISITAMTKSAISHGLSIQSLRMDDLAKKDPTRGGMRADQVEGAGKHHF